LVPRIGQKVPEFILPDTEKRFRSINEFLKEGLTAVVFFPFAFSGTCDKEMCMFRDEVDLFRSAHSTVVGVSVDSVFTLKVFAQTYNLPFPLLSDFNRKVARLFGVLQDPWVTLDYRGVAKRSVFLIDRRGILRYRWVADAPDEEPPYAEVVKAARKLAG
jgi:peroxiredoxin